MRVDVLGPCLLSEDGRVVPAGGPRQRAVVAILGLLGGTTVATARLADAVWSGDPPRTAEHTVATYVLRLRRLGVAITRVGAGYRLDSPTDVDELARLTAVSRTLDGSPRAEALAAAVALVRGDPGEGLADGDLVRGRRAELTEQVELVREEAAAAALDGSPTPAQEVPRLRALVAESPYRERRWELLVVALYRAGNQSGALEAFARARELLAGDLGIDPSPGLRRVQQAVLAQDPALAGPGARRGPEHVGGGGRALPGLATRFVGRAAEQEAVASSMRASRLVTLCGPVGAGKTRLALQHARVAADPVWFVALEGLPAGASVAAAVLAVVAPGSRAADPADGVRAALAPADGLLVLDGAEQRATEVAALVSDLLTGCPELRLLVTSRQLLRVPGEAAVTVAGLAPADRRALLIDRARLHDPGYRLRAPDLVEADRLCGLVDGLPLGIELVARHLRLLSVGELADRVDVDMDRWTATSGTAGGLGRALAAEVDALPPDLRSLLSRMAVLTAEADLALVTEVVGGNGSSGGIGGNPSSAGKASGGPNVAGSEDDVFDRLAQLVDRSLVQVRGGPVGIRYALLLAVRRHSLTLLDDRTRRAVEDVCGRAVLRRTARLAPAVSGPDRVATLLALDADAPHLQGAFAHGVDSGDAAPSLEVAAALTDYWLARRPGEGLTWLQRLLAAVPPGDIDPARRANALLQLGHLGYWLTRFGLAGRVLTEARALLGPGTDPVLLGQVLRRLGAVAAATDDIERARDLLGQSAEVLRRAGAQTEEAVSLLHLGTLLADENRTAEAVTLLVRARDALRADGDPLREAQVLNALMLSWWKAGDVAAAMGAGQRALAALAGIGPHPVEGVIAYRMAAVARVLGRPAEARDCAEAALAAGAVSGTRTTVALARLALARLDLDAGAADAAARHLAQALEVIDPGADRWVLVEALEVTARLQVERREPARWLLTRAARLRSEIGQPAAPTDAAELAALAARAGVLDGRLDHDHDHDHSHSHDHDRDHGRAVTPAGELPEDPAALREWALGRCWSFGEPRPDGETAPVAAPGVAAAGVAAAVAVPATSSTTRGAGP